MNKLNIYIYFLQTADYSWNSLEELKNIINKEFDENFTIEDISSYYSEIFYYETELIHKTVEYGITQK